MRSEGDDWLSDFWVLKNNGFQKSSDFRMVDRQRRGKDVIQLVQPDFEYFGEMSPCATGFASETKQVIHVLEKSIKYYQH